MSAFAKDGGRRPGVTPLPPEPQHVDVVYARLRDAILHGDLAPGAVIRQERVARDLEVSRTPLREALRMLEREGLAQATRNRSYRVSECSAPDLEQLYVLRLPLEAAAIRITIPALDNLDIAALEGDMAQMAHFQEVADHAHWEIPHRSFHARLVSRAGGRITRLLAELSDQSERYRRFQATQGPLAWSRGAEQHRGILDACRDGDADAGARRLAEHLAAMAMHILSSMDPSYDPAGLRLALAMATQPLTPPG